MGVGGRHYALSHGASKTVAVAGVNIRSDRDRRHIVAGYIFSYIYLDLTHNTRKREPQPLLWSVSHRT